jgi:hypothetical protein
MEVEDAAGCRRGCGVNGVGEAGERTAGVGIVDMTDGERADRQCSMERAVWFHGRAVGGWTGNEFEREGAGSSQGRAGIRCLKYS